MVQRGDIRRYNATGVDISASNTGNAISALTDTVMQLSNMAITANQQAEEMKITNYATEAKVKAYQLNQQLRQKYIDDPSNPGFKKEFEEGMNNIWGNYSVSKFAQKKFNNEKIKQLGFFELQNAEWLITQQRENTLNHAKAANYNDLEAANMFGFNGDTDSVLGLIADTKTRDSIEKLYGKDYADEFFKSRNSDIATKWIEGRIKSDPDDAVLKMDSDFVKAIMPNAADRQKLKEAAIAQAQKQAKIASYEKAISYLNKNTEMYGKVISQNATIAELNNYFLNEGKDLPIRERNTIIERAGYKTKSGSETVEFQDGVLRKSSDIAEEKEAIREARWLAVANRQVAAEELKLLKEAAYADLTMEGADLINGDAFTSGIDNGFKQIKQYQQKLNENFQKNYITAPQWKELSNSYIAPLTEFLSSNLQGLEERDWFNVLGYSEIKKYANSLPGDTEAERKKARIETALLLSNYYEELQQAAKNNKKTSIYEIETLSGVEQKKIYKEAVENAIKRTKTTSTNPHIWFKFDYPSEAAAMESKLPKIQVPDAMNNVGKQIYNAEDKLPDVPKIVEEEIRNQTIKNNQTLNNAATQAKIKELKKRGLTDEKINILMKLQENL